MSSILPINIEELLYCRGVESARIEFKASWNEKTTGQQVIKTISAFANDLQNLNGGYIVIGVAEKDGAADLPPAGLSEKDIDAAQKWIRGNSNRIDPAYQAILSPEVVNEKKILVIWAPGSDIRPHRSPDGDKSEKKYFVRIGAETVDAEKNGVLNQLIQLTARVPFDDRRALHASVEDIREGKVREFLHDIHSGLHKEKHTKELYRKLRIAEPVNGHDAPKNIGLLSFSDDPEMWFTGARIEVVQYAADAPGNIQEEKVFRGGIIEQVKAVLTYLENISSLYIEKQNHNFRVRNWVSYPIPALREALVNAVYHRSYETTPEPVKIYLYSDRVEIISYPGPIQGIKLSHLKQLESIPPVPARNRRIGEFLKELKLAEGRGTGIPKLFQAMRDNGSSDPVFDFDEERSYFRVTLPAHPEYVAISALRDAAHLRGIGDQNGAFYRIEEAWKKMPSSPSLTVELMRLFGGKGRLGDAEDVFLSFQTQSPDSFIPHVMNALIELFLDANKKDDATRYMEKMPLYVTSSDALNAAILSRRLGNQVKANTYFERTGDMLLHDTRAMHEFAQTKIKLAQTAWKRQNLSSNKRLLTEAKELLVRVTQMEADKPRHAWAWKDLAHVKTLLKLPASEIEEAYRQAILLLPDNRGFQKDFSSWQDRSKRRW